MHVAADCVEQQDGTNCGGTMLVGGYVLVKASALDAMSGPPVWKHHLRQIKACHTSSDCEPLLVTEVSCLLRYVHTSLPDPLMLI